MKSVRQLLFPILNYESRKRDGAQWRGCRSGMCSEGKYNSAGNGVNLRPLGREDLKRLGTVKECKGKCSEKTAMRSSIQVTEQDQHIIIGLNDLSFRVTCHFLHSHCKVA